jgi:antitoxin component YwqK of YwqJK toxin-antitoxin module
MYTRNYKDGKSDGLRVSYLPNGKILFKTCYKNDEEVRMSYCKK